MKNIFYAAIMSLGLTANIYAENSDQIFRQYKHFFGQLKSKPVISSVEYSKSKYHETISGKIHHIADTKDPSSYLNGKKDSNTESPLVHDYNKDIEALSYGGDTFGQCFVVYIGDDPKTQQIIDFIRFSDQGILGSSYKLENQNGKYTLKKDDAESQLVDDTPEFKAFLEEAEDLFRFVREKHKLPARK